MYPFYQSVSNQFNDETKGEYLQLIVRAASISVGREEKAAVRESEDIEKSFAQENEFQNMKPSKNIRSVVIGC